MFYHENGQVRAQGRFIDGDGSNPSESSAIPFNGRSDKWTYWYENGHKYKEGIYKDGELIVPYTLYNKDGSVIEPINIEELVEPINIEELVEVDGIFLFEHRTGFLNESQLSSQLSVFYTKDTIETYSGPVFGLYEHGQKKAEGTFGDGKKDGEWTFWMEKNEIEDQNLTQMKVIQKLLDFYRDFTGETTEDKAWAIKVVNAVRDSVVADSLFSAKPRKIVLDGREIEVTVPKSFIWMNPDRRLGQNPLAQHVRYVTTYDTAFGHLGVRKDTIVDEVYSVVVEDRSEDPDNPDTWFTDTYFIRADQLNSFIADLDTFTTKYQGITDSSQSEHVEVVHYYDRYRPDESILTFPIGDEAYQKDERTYKDSEKLGKWTEWYQNGIFIAHILVSNYGRISVDDKVIPKPHIDREMRIKRTLHPELVVSLKADKDASMELINEVLTELREADALIVKFSSDMDKGLVLVVLPPMGDVREIPNGKSENGFIRTVTVIVVNHLHMLRLT